MKKHLLKSDVNYYKAMLHLHTTCSDGGKTPEEIKEIYKAMGYSIVAYTDHELMIPHNELADDTFLPITSTEYGVYSDERVKIGFSTAKAVHLNLYSRDKNATIAPAFCEAEVIRMNREHMISRVTEEMRRAGDETRVYSTECVNSIIKRANEAGYLVSLNHPVWSLQRYEDYIDYEGLWGVEVHNSECVALGFNDTVQPFTDILDSGRQVFPLATDDWHANPARDAAGKGFVMVGAERLEYDAVFEALRQGDFYASSGPLIHAMYVEDGKLYVECSDAVSVVVSTDRRRARAAFAHSGETITSAELDIADIIEESPEVDEKYKEHGIKRRSYIRVTVNDKNSNCAYTRAYFINEII